MLGTSSVVLSLITNDLQVALRLFMPTVCGADKGNETGL